MWGLWNIVAHRYCFVWRLSVCLSGKHTLFCRRHMHCLGSGTKCIYNNWHANFNIKLYNTIWRVTFCTMYFSILYYHSRSLEILCEFPYIRSYIKEFVHGDFGRTKPNMTELTGVECDILELDVQVCTVCTRRLRLYQTQHDRNHRSGMWHSRTQCTGMYSLYTETSVVPNPTWRNSRSVTFWNSMYRYVQFVHGDFGCTKPNMTELTGVECDILELDVQVCTVCTRRLRSYQTQHDGTHRSGMWHSGTWCTGMYSLYTETSVVPNPTWRNSREQNVTFWNSIVSNWL